LEQYLVGPAGFGVLSQLEGRIGQYFQKRTRLVR
jgi:hypothetical protein